ncbi:MAG: methyltransferase domain-containing protein [Bacteroidota bacterium]
MTRLAVLILLFAFACKSDNKQVENHKEQQQDTSRIKNREPFDLQVRKYEDPKRQTWQDPKFVIEALGDLNNLIVADIGSGTGYFTFQMAVPAEKVIAIDIEQRFLNYIEDRKSEMYDRQLAGKIETRLTTPDTPSLEESEVDVVLMVNTIAYINDREDYLGKLRKGMNRGGRIIIVDYKVGKMPVGPHENFKVTEKELINTLKKTGFKVEIIDNESLQYQYLIKATNSN